ncbi:MAG: SRPBCC domain-containing protein [Bacteroidetes bacterium]|nr:MAG: SRPBCC domain-containing protein [Bacteroidota bacterium]
MQNNKVRIERIFDAPVELVWQAWTKPELLMLWFGSDPNGTVQKAEVDLRVGGAYEINFKDSDLTEHACHGIFIEIVKKSKLVFSWEWKSEPGHISQVEVNLFAFGEKTKMIFEHKNLNPDSIHNYESGWIGGFNKIDKALKTKQ